MRINTNLTAMNTYGQYTKNNNKIASSVAKLSSGYAINSAADNAAGLAISEKMRAQIRGLEKASANAQDGISLIQTAEGALAESTEILQRMRELAAQSASDTNENKIDRAALQDEFAQLKEELNDISKNTSFNKKNLLDGSVSSTKRSLGSDTSLVATGMTATIGKAAAGTYTFSVALKTVTAEVTGSAPSDANSAVNLSSVQTAYFNTTGTVSISVGTDAATTNSSLLNGNYTLSVTDVDKAQGTFTVTATGDNGQKFTCTVDTKNTDLRSGENLVLDFGDDAFEFTAELAATIGSDGTGEAASEAQLDNVDDVINGITFSISGGVDPVEEEQAYFVSLTGGGDAIKLETGMSSVTFENGVTVNFNELKATDLDTSSATNLAAVLGSGGVLTDSTVQVVAKQNAGITIQVGANEGDEMTINIDRMDAEFLGVNGENVSTQESASKALSAVDDAINQVSAQRAYLGAIQNRLDHKIANLETSTENLTSAESQIRDVDMAKEMTNFTNANILQQAATAMLAQANSLPQNVLSLIGG